MIVKFFAYIRDYTGCKEIEIPYEETIYKLIYKLCEKYGEKLKKKLLSEDGKSFGKDIIILVNGRHVEHLCGINTILKPDDIVLIFPVVAGG